jgi:hypothetical protein
MIKLNKVKQDKSTEEILIGVKHIISVQINSSSSNIDNKKLTKINVIGAMIDSFIVKETIQKVFELINNKK